jgi:nitrogen regulatory protein P-II 1
METGSGVKLIRSVIRPSKIDDLKAALCRVNVLGLTVTPVTDHSPYNWHTVGWMGHEHKLNFLPRCEVVAVVQDDDVDEVVAVIIRTARTRHLADGHVSVLPVEHRYNIHTGEREVV